MPKPPLKPYWATRDSQMVCLYHGDVSEVLGRMPAQRVQCIVTSPPYWGLRDYGTDKSLEIGSEPTPDEYVERMVEVFRGVRRVLRDDGVVWINLGDTYSVGNLIGIPWRVALALQGDGWVLRQDIIYSKPNPMPESVRNRCTKAHEYVFLLAKRMGYYYDVEAVKETSIDPESLTGRKPRQEDKFVQAQIGETARYRSGFAKRDGQVYLRRNKRSVWTIASEIYEGAHFATFPQKLVEPCILAGTSERGCCGACGAPWRRLIEGKKLTRPRPNEYVKRTGVAGTGSSCANTVAGVENRTVGWEPTCGCGTGDVVPCNVLDPFVGSGVTCVVALAHGRRSWGIDLSEAYLRNNAIPRIEGVLLSRPALSYLVRANACRLGIGRDVLKR